ncbi:glycosyltransferase [Burkholderia glumae]|uniref:glycosyltransferase n=1 Tax=Burkholderia glumae TaxID=337 RepID=UPI0020B2AE26|nr:glycosyltransferase [Burkholderia glumae]MCQ0031954.1 glycosyltransferase [Burkholderia glumae]MCQ0037048.1 glycosyltransferase [Burkholderia glumae]
MFDTRFSGRIIQLTEALDYGDAVSGQVIALDRMFKQLGLRSSIYSKWHHDEVAQYRSNLDALEIQDSDVLVIHFAGYSEHVMDAFHTKRCTKICVYHNVTPHEFFEPGTDLYKFCLLGREQLREVVSSFDYFWGDSEYNLREIIDLGVSPDRCSVVPIIIDPPAPGHIEPALTQRQRGNWLFLGRIAPNKGQVELVELFADMHRRSPGIASRLSIVGGFNPQDPYYSKLLATIKKHDVGHLVDITGKVPDETVLRYLSEAFIYVSLSRHEGFGVPLIEAALHGLPVVALSDAAVGETLGVTGDPLDSIDKLRAEITRLSNDSHAYQALLAFQRKNAERFAHDAVRERVVSALRRVLPEGGRYATVSVIICTYNRGDLLDRCLDYLRYQTNQNFEVVVVNGPSDDNTDEVLERYRDRIKIGVNPQRNLAVSRNIGIELADGDLLAFIDDDALPFDGWVETLLDEFNRRPLTLGALGGPAYYAGTLRYQSEDIGINRFAEAKVNIDSREIGEGGWERSLLGTNTCFSAEAMRSVKGFDEQFDYFLDESELCFRMRREGYIVAYRPDLYLRHEFAQSHNRQGRHNYNWFSICKNTAYYVAAYSGLKGSALRKYLDHRMQSERIAPLQAAYRAGEIGKEEFERHLKAINSGVEQGLKDVADFPKTRAMQASPGKFTAFTRAASSPLVGRDTPSLHICIVSKEFSSYSASGGIGTLYYHLASELLLMGHQITLITPGDAPTLYRCGRFSVRYVPLQSNATDPFGSTGFVNNLNWGMCALRAVAELHAEHRIDVIESALWDAEALPIALLPKESRPPLVLRLVTPFPVAARLNGWQMPQREADLFLAGETALIENADLVVPISESIANTIEREHSIERDARWSLSHCGIAYWPFFDASAGYAVLEDAAGKPLKVSANMKFVLFVGRLEGRKGVGTLLEAARRFLRDDPDVHLVLAGRDIENWTERANGMIDAALASRVHFLGSVDDQVREKLLNAAHCVVFPSQYESFGLVPLEAFVHGTPVVAARAGAIPEVVAENVSGLLFESGNADELANCVMRMLTDTALHARLTKGAREQIRVFSSRNSAIRAVQAYIALRQARGAGQSVDATRDVTSAAI